MTAGALLKDPRPDPVGSNREPSKSFMQGNDVFRLGFRGID